MTIEDHLRPQAKKDGYEWLLDEAIESARLLPDEVSYTYRACYVTGYYTQKKARYEKEIKEYINEK